MNIKDQYLELVLQGEHPLIFDGGMGSMLMKMGLSQAGKLGDMLNLTNPQAITEVHKAYVNAGSQVIITNTFNSNALNLAKQDGTPSVKNMYAAAVENARAANPEYIAGDIGPLGQLLEPYGDLEADAAYDLFAEQVDAACKAGVDLLLVETMQNLEEAELATRAAADFGSVPVISTMSFEAHGKTMYGTSPADAANVLQTVGASIIGANCGLGPVEMLPIAKEFVANAFVPVLIQPNAGAPRVESGETVYDIGVEEFVAAMRKICALGVNCVGGCCGTTPEYIAPVAALF